MHPRRALLTDAIRALLREPRFAVLATLNRDGTPHLTVMWYELRDDAIVFNTREGRVKDRNLRRDPRCSLVLEDGYRFVRLDGRVKRVSDRERAQDDIRRLAVRYHGEESGERMARETFATQERVTYVMEIEKVYAPGIQ